MNTFHDHYKCAGDFIWNSDMKSCEGPIMDCNQLKEELRQPCQDMVTSFMKMPDNAKTIWESMMMKGKVYQACVALAKCDKDPPGPKGTKGTPCHEAFRSSACDGKLSCAAFDTQCTPQCYLCQIIIRDWPLFQETCKPAGATLPNAIDVDEDAEAAAHPFAGTKTEKAGATGAAAAAHSGPPAAGSTPPAKGTPSPSPSPTSKTFLELLSEAMTTTAVPAPHTTTPPTTSTTPAHNALQPAGAAGGDDITQVVDGYTLTEECFRQYNAVVLSKKTRYFAQFKKDVSIMIDNKDRLFGNYWDANIACKCIGMCPLGRFEDLSLMNVCRYGTFEEMFSELAFGATQHM